VKLAVTASGPDRTSLVDPRFGRAKYLLIVDMPERSTLAVDNQSGVNAAQGAGIQAAQSVIDHGASVVITGHCGPKATQALGAGGIEVYFTAGGTVDEALSRFETDRLRPGSGEAHGIDTKDKEA
jgi:predicted Fe-Mo cluster-binding NifX family protein